jgi:copper chaperone CopZ
MQNATIQLEMLSCPSCMQKIFNSSKVKVDFDSEALEIGDIEKAIEDLGYSVIKSKIKSA